jgi:hypothetical protein
MDVAAWLRGLGLERYAEAFRANEIDAEVLPRLTAEDLTALGVTAIGHRRRLLDAIALLRDGTAPASDQPAEGSIVKTAKKRPLLAIPKKTEKSGMMVSTIPKEKTAKKSTKEGPMTRLSMISFFFRRRCPGFNFSLRGRVSFRRYKMTMESKDTALEQ